MALSCLRRHDTSCLNFHITQVTCIRFKGFTMFCHVFESLQSDITNESMVSFAVIITHISPGDYCLDNSSSGL